jgi:hypothetical protein
MPFTRDHASARRHSKSTSVGSSVLGVIGHNREPPLKSESSHKPAYALRPALVSIPAACQYLGGISRSKFYADILPLLETVKIDNRHLVVVAALDAFIAARRQRAG